MPSRSAASWVVSSAFSGMTVTPCPRAIAVATWTSASNTGPGTSSRVPSALTSAGFVSGTATPRRASSATKSTTSASWRPSRRYVVASVPAARALMSTALPLPALYPGYRSTKKPKRMLKGWIGKAAVIGRRLLDPAWPGIADEAARVWSDAAAGACSRKFLL